MVVIAFGAVVGPQASVLRAVVMAVLMLAALLLDRDTEVVNSLAAAALAILAFRPHDLSDPGFQLSFAATAGIVLAPHPQHMVLGALVVSVAAQAAVLPITLWHFHQVSLAGVLAKFTPPPPTNLDDRPDMIAAAARGRERILTLAKRMLGETK